ncbi:hypothetical protein GDO81_021660 [Engystomops pustulosus]|uniref:Basic proline-rich protein-like n=1 Tax=Engystomops pustulosus TaxID=76066 RepID=A0AAV6ZTS6_ENGPU|nr:hypothetical protein GDO81_021660 [Engystomops pustulosus]
MVVPGWMPSCSATLLLQTGHSLWIPLLPATCHPGPPPRPPELLASAFSRPQRGTSSDPMTPVCWAPTRPHPLLGAAHPSAAPGRIPSSAPGRIPSSHQPHPLLGTRPLPSSAPAASLLGTRPPLLGTSRIPLLGTRPHPPSAQAASPCLRKPDPPLIHQAPAPPASPAPPPPRHQSPAPPPRTSRNPPTHRHPVPPAPYLAPLDTGRGRKPPSPAISVEGGPAPHRRPPDRLSPSSPSLGRRRGAARRRTAAPQPRGPSKKDDRSRSAGPSIKILWRESSRGQGPTLLCSRVSCTLTCRPKFYPLPAFLHQSPMIPLPPCCLVAPSHPPCA